MYEKPVLGLPEAMIALDAMLKEAAKESERPLAMAIVDDNGELVCYGRMDRVNPLPRQLAVKKAYTAARMRADTLAFAERLKSQGRSVIEMGDPNLTSVQGGIAIVRLSDGTVLGGIGVSGRRAEEDEEIARIGLRAMNL
ncbi:MAG: heme-binding protein [Chloroflexi bacterium]|nr:heme-binding protein [Chloroflexota bacterium]